MSKQKKILLVIALLLLIGLGVGAFLYFRKKEEETATPAIVASTPAAAGTIMASTPLSREEQVKQVYLQVLGREADASGLAYWVSTPLSINEIRGRFYASDEYLQKLA